jgi:N-acetylglucosaminyldiphosphoundecaprenol N-acetyl-beta-D-mannosaminyltransferase
MHARRNPAVARVLQQADAVFADGIAPAMLAALRGAPLPGRVSGPSFLPAAMAHGVSLGWRHFLYGGASGVADRLAERLREQHPGLNICGTCSPPFRPSTDQEERALEQTIRATRPDVLWVALGSPGQELWVGRHAARLPVPVMLPVGAAFDFHSGARPWAPAWVRQLGLEWAFRMMTGGRRTLARNSRCVPSVAGMLAQATAVAVRERCRRRLRVALRQGEP